MGIAGLPITEENSMLPWISFASASGNRNNLSLHTWTSYLRYLCVRQTNIVNFVTFMTN